MIKILKNFFSILSKDQVKFFYKLQILIAISSLLEIASIGFLALYLSNILNVGTFFSFFKDISYISDFSESEIVLILSSILILLFLISTITNILSIKYQNSFMNYVGSDFSQRLYNFYLNQNYLYFVDNDINFIFKKITADVQRFTDQFLRGLVTALSKILICFLIFTVLLIYNLKITLIVFFLLFFFYALTVNLFKKKIDRSGKEITFQQGLIYDYVSNTFAGIREAIYYDRKKFLKEQIKKNLNAMAHNLISIKTIGSIPKYIIELVSFSILIIIISILTINSLADNIILNLAIFGSAGYKLLPAMQAIYYSLTDLYGHRDSFEAIYPELKDDKFNNQNSRNNTLDKKKINKISSIKFKDVSFSYKKSLTINKVDLVFENNQKIGIVGKSGSGKSTIIDLLLGFIKPDKGSILFNNEEMKLLSIKSIRNLIGFVSQGIFLFNDTISKNISIDKLYDRKLIEKLSRICLIDDFLKDNNIDIERDKIGNYGKSLSGGQKQRIGIARALYNNPKVLILDEATSALDSMNQNKILSNIFQYTEVKIIILITHNTSLLKSFDNIFVLDEGSIVSEGDYDKLSARSLLFKELSIDKEFNKKI